MHQLIHFAIVQNTVEENQSSFTAPNGDDRYRTKIKPNIPRSD